MSASDRNLHAVPETEAEIPEEGAPNVAGGTPWWAWIALVGFVLCAAGWYASQRGATELRSELEVSQAALAGAQVELRAHQTHLARVQERSDVLAGDLQALALVAQQLAEDVSRDPRVPLPLPLPRGSGADTGE